MRLVHLADPSSLPDPYLLVPFDGPVDAVVTPPGSKSVTNRALICAALADGSSTLTGALFADDTEAMLGVLAALGVETTSDRSAGTIIVPGCAGAVPSSAEEIDVRQSGTTARFALPLLALGRGAYRVTAHRQMQARPMATSFAALRSLGVGVEALDRPGSLPVTVTGGMRSGVARVAGDVSSQFLSGLLLAAPCLPDGLVIEVTTDLISRPYVDLTIEVMAAFGATVEQPDRQTFVVAAGGYHATRYRVEPDATAASYLLGVAAACGGQVTVPGLGSASGQGDVHFVDVLAQMGAAVALEPDQVTVRVDGRLHGVDVDLEPMSDTAQTLAAIAVYADGPTRVRGVGFIRNKETDRIGAVVAELRRLGIEADEEPDGFTVRPGAPAPGIVQTYDDHRMAMSFALLGLRAPGIQLANPACVAKTFPTFFAVLESMRPGLSRPRGRVQ